jgi:hypothetical protein
MIEHCLDPWWYRGLGELKEDERGWFYEVVFGSFEEEEVVTDWIDCADDNRMTHYKKLGEVWANEVRYPDELFQEAVIRKKGEWSKLSFPWRCIYENRK